MSFFTRDNPTSGGLSREVLSLTNQNRITVPIGSSLSRVQRKGSLIWDSRLQALYMSDGEQWLAVVAVDSSGDSTVSLKCIEDKDKDTSVCTDDADGTDTDTIRFTTAGTERARFDSAGVFIATKGDVNPNTITPAAGKVAHFEGDVKITGVLDPIGLELDEQSSTPLDPTGTTTGVLYVKDNSPNTLMFVDNSGVEHVLNEIIDTFTLNFGNGTTDAWGNNGPISADILYRLKGRLCTVYFPVVKANAQGGFNQYIEFGTLPPMIRPAGRNVFIVHARDNLGDVVAYLRIEANGKMFLERLGTLWTGLSTGGQTGIFFQFSVSYITP